MAECARPAAIRSSVSGRNNSNFVRWLQNRRLLPAHFELQRPDQVMKFSCEGGVVKSSLPARCKQCEQIAIGCTLVQILNQPLQTRHTPALGTRPSEGYTWIGLSPIVPEDNHVGAASVSASRMSQGAFWLPGSASTSLTAWRIGPSEMWTMLPKPCSNSGNIPAAPATAKAPIAW